MDEASIDALKEAIKNLHGCDSAWVEAVPVRETFAGQTVCKALLIPPKPPCERPSCKRPASKAGENHPGPN